MRLTSLLLRLLLCLGLVINGVAPVRASVAAMAGSVAAPSVEPGAHAMAPCHGQQGGDRPAAAGAHGASHDDPGPAPCAVEDGGCCEGDSCLCDGLAQPSMLQWVAPAGASPPPRIDIAFVAAPWRGPPRLPHLMRPPIG